MLKKIAVCIVALTVARCNQNECPPVCAKPFQPSGDKKQQTNLVMQEKQLACKLTSTGLSERKSTVIAELKTMLRDNKELNNGYSFKFPGDGKTIDLLADFVKGERQCCDFFSFSIHVAGTGDAWLEITGPGGTKEFIETELGL